MNVYFIVNGNAGNGRGIKIWNKFSKKLSFKYTVFLTQYQNHAIEIVNHIIGLEEKTCLVIGVGGDGTLREITSGAVRSKSIVVSAIKAGSGNDFARGYTVFQRAEDVNKYVHEQLLHYKDNDIGCVVTQDKQAHFVNNIGFGFDALVATTVNKAPIKKILNKCGLGRLAYVLLTIKLLFTFKKFSADVLIDNKHYHFDHIWFIAICNQPYFGGGMKISPRSKMDDHCLEFVIVQYLSPIKLLLLFLSVFTGKHEKLKEIKFIQAKQVEMSFNGQIVSHVDGDLYEQIAPSTKVSVSVQNKAWKLAK